MLRVFHARLRLEFLQARRPLTPDLPLLLKGLQEVFDPDMTANHCGVCPYIYTVSITDSSVHHCTFGSVAV